MQTIRIGIFETNSSSTHVLCTIKIDDYKKWKKGELYYYPRDVFEENDFISDEKAENKKNFIYEEYYDELGFDKCYDDSDLFKLLLKNNYPIIGFYPLNYDEYKEYCNVKYKESITETESDRFYFGGKGYIKFHRWISDIYD